MQSVTLSEITERCRKERGFEEILFLRLNCEGCEFEVVTSRGFEQVATHIRFIGGEIHGAEDGQEWQQRLVGGAAMDPHAAEATFEALCTDKYFPDSNRDFEACRDTKYGKRHGERDHDEESDLNDLPSNEE